MYRIVLNHLDNVVFEHVAIEAPNSILGTVKLEISLFLQT